MSQNRKVWITFMCQGGEEENIKELLTPQVLEHFHGVIAVIHDAPNDDKGLLYLESVKGEGQIIRRQWVKRHDYSMNEIFYCGVIQSGDIVISIDLLERIPARFAAIIQTECLSLMKDLEVECLAYYGKPYVYLYNESMQFYGSPHWSLVGLIPNKHGAYAFDLANIYKDEKMVRENVRPVKRPDTRHFCQHYLVYYLYPPGANTLLLGLEKNGNPQELFGKLELQRLHFREMLRTNGYPITVEGVKKLIDDGLNDYFKAFFNGEKILNDFYRYYKLKDYSFPDDHDFKNMIVIP